MKISFLIPTYNEEENVLPLSEAIIAEVEKLGKYDYEIVFIDNDSKDKTRPILEEMCAGNKKIKAIFNARNFGQFNSPFYGLMQTSGDCTISMCADFQDPPEMIPSLVAEWEKGNKIVCAVKSKSKENRLARLGRSVYYKLMHRYSDIEMIEHFTGTGLYDRSFIEVLRTLDDPAPFMRGIVAELGYKIVEVPYTQQKRRAGKSSNNFSTLYDAAMLSISSYSKLPVRLSVVVAFVFFLLGLVGGIAYAVCAALWWDVLKEFTFVAVICALFICAAAVLFFIGMLGEYLITIKKKVTARPLVIEEKRINF